MVFAPDIVPLLNLIHFKAMNAPVSDQRDYKPTLSYLKNVSTFQSHLSLRIKRNTRNRKHGAKTSQEHKKTGIQKNIIPKLSIIKKGKQT